MADTKKPAGAETKPLNPPPAPAEMTAALEPKTDQGEFADTGFVIEREGGNGELPSYFTKGETGPGWTWDKEQATVFKKKEDAAKLIAEKTDKAPAGVASGEGAKVVKASN